MCDTTIQLAEMANRSVTFLPANSDEAWPTLVIAGMHVAVHLDPQSRTVDVAIGLEDSAPWLSRPDADRTVPLRISIQGHIVFDG